ncbi:conserved hypothetical protein (plasmid) [Methylobacterium nodulans ORS 2060]|uniref:Tellurite resistance protein TerB n=1 Tax=Methylobacterium nodulans (strain LMG 21967 / CNCM I-2342 / ORS 2060) TaxID=460265 RepID=B8IW50_METNO|nr:conserved hypothetical protein [Methylobacterium nodulans ORS 2060]
MAGFILPGLVYVGDSLPSATGFGRSDNCLIDPRLPVAKGNADISGQYMDYWPAYESMRPSSRRALLEWLSGERSDPGTYIGYVFVYLYGLERRAVLDGSAEERPAIRSEVERLLAVYRHNGSFRRYAGELLSALDILDLGPDDDPLPVFAPSGGSLPPAVSIAIGRRIRAGQPIEGDWLLAWTMAHPETRVRTAARRAFDYLRQGFADEFRRRHPSGGLVVKPRQGKAAPIAYHAASGTFTATLGAERLGRLPDLSRYPEPLALGRELLEICTDRLDAYSRHLGRTTGEAAAPMLQAVALLPPGLLRERALTGPAGESLEWLSARAHDSLPVPFAEVSIQVSGQTAEKATPARLRNLADILCRFGLGLVPDPRFPTRLPAGTSSILLFPFDAPCETVVGPSDAYMAAFLTLSVGVLIAKADGVISADERAALRDMASGAPGTSPTERCRLAADARWLEANPVELSSLRARLSDLGEHHRQAVGDALVRVASSDGTHHRAEVSLLEKVFRQLGLERDRLYAGLHRAGRDPAPPDMASGAADEPVRVVAGPVQEKTYAIPAVPSEALPGTLTPPEPVNDRAPQPIDGAASATAPAAAGPADIDRLAAIRAETAAISSVLAGVFEAMADGGDNLPAMAAPSAETSEAAEMDGVFDGLDARYDQFLRELAGRAAWPRAAFDRLAREFGLMPGAAMEDLNRWAFDRFDDVLVEEGDPILINLHLIPASLPAAA